MHETKSNSVNSPIISVNNLELLANKMLLRQAGTIALGFVAISVASAASSSAKEQSVFPGSELEPSLRGSLGHRNLQSTCNCAAAPAAQYTYWFPNEAGTETCWPTVCICYGTTNTGTQNAAAGTAGNIILPARTSWQLVFTTDPICSGSSGTATSPSISPTMAAAVLPTPSSTGTKAAVIASSLTSTPTRLPVAVSPPQTPTRLAAAPSQSSSATRAAVIAPSPSSTGSKVPATPFPSSSSNVTKVPVSTSTTVGGGGTCPGGTPSPWTSLGGRILDYIAKRGETSSVTGPQKIKGPFQ